MVKDKIVYKGHLYVVAQDPLAEDPFATPDAPAGDAPAEDPAAAEDPDKPTQEEVAKEIDESPAAKWREYIPNIIKDLEVRFNGEKISLRGEARVSDSDPDIGFYITGFIHFVNGRPQEVKNQYGNAPLHFDVFVDGDGKLHYQRIKVYTEL